MTAEQHREFVEQYRRLHGDACVTCGAPVEEHRLLYEDLAADVRPERLSLFRCRRCLTAVTFPLLGEEECGALYDAGYRQIPTGELDYREPAPGTDGATPHGPRKSPLWALQDWISRELVSRTFCRTDGRRRLLRRLLFARPFARIFHGHPHFLPRPVRGTPAFLDFGCGRGEFLGTFPPDAGFRAEGLDLNPRAVALCRARGLAVSQGSIGDLPRRDYQFIRAWHVLEHAARPQDYLAAFHRHLAPGGVLILGLPNFDPWPYRLLGRCGLGQWMHLPYHRFHWNARNVGTLLARHGFRPLSVKSKTMGPWKVFGVAHRRNVRGRPPLPPWALLALKLLELPVDLGLDLVQSGDMLEVYARRGPA